uniref:glypican-5 isoform X5 n=1 Tax=Monopterus albus TaxID=43700 RepID=UPI0009B37F02|nr:glypican-5-like isoform X5 [Monopterus albus]
MSRGICTRVNSCGAFWMLSAVTIAVNVIIVDAYSCHEVRTAFQLRQVGPLHRVPETPGTDVDLLVCKHEGPSCCTRKMEESYQLAVKRETLQNIRTYSFELEHLISRHSDAFQDMFQYLLSFSQGHLSSLLELINPGVEGSMTVGSEMDDCLRMIRQDVNPFGSHPAIMAQELAGTLGAGRQLGLALEVGLDMMNATEHFSLSKECVKGLVKMVYCSHCRGLTLIKPCMGYCLNVMRGCLASMSELDQPWRRYTSLLDQLTNAMAGRHSLELSLLRVREYVNEALLYAQLHGVLITATVDKVCGLSTGEPTGKQSASPEVTTSNVTSSSPLPSAASSQPLPEQLLGQFAHLRSTSSPPLKPFRNNKHSLRTLSREFLIVLQRFRSFFTALPEMLCDGENVMDDSMCWSGDNVVESYSGRVVGNGLQAQRQNPEVKVRNPDPSLAEVKERLEQFNQEIQESFPKLGQIEAWDELSSGETEEGSTTDCDDEDGCQASGDSQEKISGSDGSSVGNPFGRQPGGNSPQDDPSKPPSVKVIGSPSSANWAQSWSLALLFAACCLQWTLF